MAKRFTETNKWLDAWYIDLSNDNKIVWQYLLDNCSIAGIIKISIKHLNFCCSTEFKIEDIENTFENRLIKLNGFYFIPKFIYFQYPKGLTSEKPAIVSVRNELRKYSLLNADNTLVTIENGKIKQPFHNDCQIIKDKDKDMVIDKDKEQDKEKPEIKIENWGKGFLNGVDLKTNYSGNEVYCFNVAYNHYPKKESSNSPKLQTYVSDFRQKICNLQEYNRLLLAISYYKSDFTGKIQHYKNFGDFLKCYPDYL